jgi:hypothetical protein
MESITDMNDTAKAEVSAKPTSADKITQSRKSRRKGKSSKKAAEYRPYPRVPLEKTVAVARAIKEKNGGNPWPAAEIAAVLGVSPKGVAFTYYLHFIEEVRPN